MAEDLFRPRFKFTVFQAVRRRLMKNYILMFIVTFVSWSGQRSLRTGGASRR